MYRNTYVLINKRSIENNVKEIVNKYNYKYYIGVVKANVYGHGLNVIDSMIKGGINYLAVSSLDEAVRVRQVYESIPILVLEPIDLKYIEVAVSNRITITLENYEYYQKLIGINISGKLLIHLKIDSGMNRLGFNDLNKIEQTVEGIKNNDNFVLEGIYTHLATSGIFDKFYQNQICKFRELTSTIDLTSIPIVHIGKSSTLVSHDKLDFVNAIRLGIIMFGFNPKFKIGNGFKNRLRMIKRNYLIKKGALIDAHLDNNLELTKSFKLFTEIMSIKNVSKSNMIGYAEYIASEDMVLAILPIGFADGIKGIKYVSINNKRYDVIAGMCMDMTFIKIDETIKVGDKVEIFGDNIDISEVTNYLGINAYQLLSRISSRVERKYIDE